MAVAAGVWLDVTPALGQRESHCLQAMHSSTDSLGAGWDAAFASSALELPPCLMSHRKGQLCIVQLLSASVPGLQQLWVKRHRALKGTWKWDTNPKAGLPMGGGEHGESLAASLRIDPAHCVACPGHILP